MTVSIKIEKLISNAIIEHLSDRVTNIVVSLNCDISAVLPYLEPSHRKSVVFTKNSFTNENAINKEVISEIRSLAAKAWLFNLLVVDAIPENFHTNFENLVFQLKNLGFCRIINLSKSNDKFLSQQCKKYNLYYKTYH